MLAQVEELALEDGIVLRVRAQLERVPNRFLPWARDLDDTILLLDEAEPDRSAAQVDEHEDEEGDVANIDRQVEQVDELLLRLHLQQVVGEEDDRLRFGA